MLSVLCMKAMTRFATSSTITAPEAAETPGGPGGPGGPVRYCFKFPPICQNSLMGLVIQHNVVIDIGPLEAKTTSHSGCTLQCTGPFHLNLTHSNLFRVDLAVQEVREILVLMCPLVQRKILLKCRKMLPVYRSCSSAKGADIFRWGQTPTLYGKPGSVRHLLPPSNSWKTWSTCQERQSYIQLFTTQVCYFHFNC